MNVISLCSRANAGGLEVKLKEILQGPGRHISKDLHLQVAAAGYIAR